MARPGATCARHCSRAWPCGRPRSSPPWPSSSPWPSACPSTAASPAAATSPSSWPMPPVGPCSAAASPSSPLSAARPWRRGAWGDAGHAAGGQHPVSTARAECRGLARPICRCGQPLPGMALIGTGAHNTCSIVGAPVASITKRSKPSAMPLAGGIRASAARKSSSMG